METALGDKRPGLFHGAEANGGSVDERESIAGSRAWFEEALQVVLHRAAAE